MSREKYPFPFDVEARGISIAFTRDAGEKFRLVQESYVSRQNVQMFSHGGAWQAHHSYDPDRVSETKTLGHETKLDLDDIVLGRLIVIERTLDEIVNSMEASFAKSFYEMISGVCEEHGNVVASGLSLGEQFLQALETIEFSVDRDGNVNLPEFRVGMGMAERLKNDPSVNSPELLARVDAVTEMKTAQALEKEAARKAKFRKEGE